MVLNKSQNMTYCGFQQGFLLMMNDLPDQVSVRTQEVLDSEGHSAHICSDYFFVRELTRKWDPPVNLDRGCTCDNNLCRVRQWGRDFQKMIRLTKKQ